MGGGEGESRASLAKAKKELEDLYLGVPDESVNLTFQDFAQVSRQQNKNKLSPISSPVNQAQGQPSSPLSKLPSLDFSKGLEQPSSYSCSNPNPNPNPYPSHHHHDQRDDMSVVAYGYGGRRRPGIPHSNICAICCNYIYIYRHRCLVCGRVYCRQCVSDGMGEMSQGRKCIDCLGRRFSQRYIHKAGNVGCCMGYPSIVKQQELKWAERGARSGGENRSRTPMGPVSRSPGPGTPSRQASSTEPPSFVLNSPYSPYSPTNHHPMPF